MTNSQGSQPRDERAGGRRGALVLATLLVGILLHPAFAATCAVAPASTVGLASAKVWHGVSPGATSVAVVYTLDTIFVDYFECKTGGP